MPDIKKLTDKNGSQIYPETDINAINGINEYITEITDSIQQSNIKLNDPISVAEFIGVAKSYYNARYKEDGTPLLFYNTTYTPLSDYFDVTDDTYGGAIDCSTYIGLALRGIPIEKSPYKSLLGSNINNDDSLIEDDSSNESGNDGSDNDVWDANSVIANKTDYAWAINPFEWSLPVTGENDIKPVRRASQLAQWMFERGLSIPLDQTFSNVEPGDIIFWAKTDSNGNYTQPNRYKHISHVAMCVNKKDAPTDDPNFPDGYPWKHTMLEVTTISPYVLNRTLEKIRPHEVVMICRPDLGSISTDRFAGNITTTLGITNISELYRPGFYYLTSSITDGLPEGIETGIYLALRVERTITRLGKPYSIVQTIINTRTNECEYVRTQYCYSHAPNTTDWTDWRCNDNSDIEKRLKALEELVAGLKNEEN